MHKAVPLIPFKDITPGLYFDDIAHNLWLKIGKENEVRNALRMADRSFRYFEGHILVYNIENIESLVQQKVHED